jgi:hypothetical protein
VRQHGNRLRERCASIYATTHGCLLPRLRQMSVSELISTRRREDAKRAYRPLGSVGSDMMASVIALVMFGVARGRQSKSDYAKV